MIALKAVKRHLSIDHTRDDTLIESYVAGAITAAETFTGRIIKRRALQIKRDGFGPSPIELPTPLFSVDEVLYLDVVGEEQTLNPDQYEIEPGLYGYLEPSYGNRWPSTQGGRKRSVTITCTSGYSPETLPADALIAVLSMVGQMYENREPTAAVQLYEVPMSFHYLLNPYRRIHI